MIDDLERLLGRAVFHLWPDLPRDMQERIFEAASRDPFIRRRLAVVLHHSTSQDSVPATTPRPSLGRAIDGDASHPGQRPIGLIQRPSTAARRTGMMVIGQLPLCSTFLRACR